MVIDGGMNAALSGAFLVPASNPTDVHERPHISLESHEHVGVPKDWHIWPEAIARGTRWPPA